MKQVLQFVEANLSTKFCYCNKPLLIHPSHSAMSTFEPAVILSLLKNLNTQGADRKAFENTWNVNVSVKGHGRSFHPGNLVLQTGEKQSQWLEKAAWATPIIRFPAHLGVKCCGVCQLLVPSDQGPWEQQEHTTKATIKGYSSPGSTFHPTIIFSHPKVACSTHYWTWISLFEATEHCPSILLSQTCSLSTVQIQLSVVGGMDDHRVPRCPWC